MLKQRVITAAILVVIMAVALAWSPAAFAVVATAVLGLALMEWLQLTGASRSASVLLSAMVSVVLLYIGVIERGVIPRVAFPLSALATVIWLLIAAMLFHPKAMTFRLPRVAGMALALLLVVAGWFALMQLLLQGAAMLLSVLLIVWIADTAAYFAGRAYGRRKLAPHISPGKTWAGVVGAIFAVMVVALLVRQLVSTAPLYTNHLFAGIGILPALLVMAWLVALSVVGDLFESLQKRQAGVKDSGQMLPGHGGMLDRVDALVPLLPAAVLTQWLIQ